MVMVSGKMGGTKKSLQMNGFSSALLDIGPGLMGEEMIIMYVTSYFQWVVVQINGQT